MLSPPPPAITAESSRLQLCGAQGALGVLELRQKLAKSYKDRYGVGVEPEEVIITTGSSGAFLVSFTALFDVGSRVAMATPGYPCYRNILQSRELPSLSPPSQQENCHHHHHLPTLATRHLTIFQFP